MRSTILATTSKFKMAVEIGVFRLIREARYTFVLRSHQLPQNFVGSFKLTCQLFTRLGRPFIISGIVDLPKAQKTVERIFDFWPRLDSMAQK